MSIRAFLADRAAAFGLIRAPQPEPEIVRADPQPVAAVPEVVERPAVLQRAAPVWRKPRTKVATYIVAHKFVLWMQDQGATGYWLVDEIDELREAFCDRFNLMVPNAYEFRSHLAVAEGVKKGRYRLNSWEFLDVKTRTSQERPVLYRIADKAVSDAVTRECPDDVPSRPEHVPSRPVSARSRSGQNRDTIKRRGKTKRYERHLEAA